MNVNKFFDIAAEEEDDEPVKHKGNLKDDPTMFYKKNQLKRRNPDMKDVIGNLEKRGHLL